MIIHIQFVPFVCFKQIVAEDNKREMKKKRKKGTKSHLLSFLDPTPTLLLKNQPWKLGRCVCVYVCVCVLDDCLELE